MKIGDICEVNATTVCVSATLSEVAHLLCNSYMDAIVVVASPVRRPTAIGIITYRQLLDTLTRGGDLESTHVLNVLEKNPLLLNEEEQIDDAIAKLRARGAKHAPVTGNGGTLHGTISLERLLGCRAVSLQRSSAAIAESTYK